MNSLILYLALTGLVASEGFSPLPYELDGVWHIGFGYNLEEHLPNPGRDCPDYSCMRWTKEHSFQMLVKDVVQSHESLDRAVSCYPFLQPKAQVVLIDMVYNMGLTATLKFKQTIKAMCAHEYDWAAYHLLDSRYARKLPRRAGRNASTLRGDYTL